MSDLKMLVTTSLTQAYKNRNNYDMLLCIPVYKVCMILKVSNVFSAVLISECRRSWDNPWRSCGDEWRRTRIQKGVHQQWIRCRKITSLFKSITLMQWSFQIHDYIYLKKIELKYVVLYCIYLKQIYLHIKVLRLLVILL